MKFPPHCLIIVACLGWGIAPQPWAQRLIRDDGILQASHMDLLACMAVFFALISILLLWRQRRLRNELASLHRQLAGENGLRGRAGQAMPDTHANLCELIALQDGVKENERRRIARDIHDDLGQNLLALKIDISLLQMSTADAHPIINQKLGLIAKNVDLTIKSLRCIINGLRPISLEAGLKTALDWQLSEFSRINGIRYELKVDQGVFDGSASDAVDTVVFRILQESLSNIVRHAKATEVKIALCRSADGLTMTVNDNGVGMPAGSFLRGCGLLGMEERVTAVGGQLVIASEPGHGTALSLSIPLADANPSSTCPESQLRRPVARDE